MRQRIELEVPYSEKDEAKALGAWWDPVVRTWYVPSWKEPGPFRKWLPTIPEEDLMTLVPPVFMVESRAECWKCCQGVTVVTLASCLAAEETEPGRVRGAAEGCLELFCDITYLPSPLLPTLRRLNPGYRKRFSKTAGASYFMNHCRCGAQLGDFYLHAEPGAAFFPVEQEMAASMKLHGVLRVGTLRIAGGAHSSSPNLIQEHAQRIPGDGWGRQE